MFVTLRSFSTSPLFGNYYGGFYSSNSGYNADSAQFQTIGKWWLKGKVPYRDLFDHKGPMIFFIDMIGYTLGGRTGIAIIQTLFLTVTLIAIFKIVKLKIKRLEFGIFSCILFLVYLTFSYAEGNSVQEYALPFILLATYHIVSFLTSPSSSQKKHNPRLAVFYGVVIGFCFLDLVTCAIPICCGIIGILYSLIKNKSYKNIRKNIIFGVIGFLAITVPFFIYFIVNNAFGDFIYASIIFNMKYVKQIGSWLNGKTTGDQIVSFLYCYSTYLFTLVTAILVLRRKAYSYAIFLFLTFFVETYLFFKGEAFEQYAMITIIGLPLLLNELYIKNMKKHSYFSIYRLSILFVILIVGFHQFESVVRYVPNKRIGVLNPEIIGYEEIIEKHKKELKNSSFSVYGENELKDIYLKYDFTPAMKYFAIQDWHAKFDDITYDNIKNDFKTTKTEYLLVGTYEKKFKQIIENRYTKIDNSDDNKYVLYRLNI